MVFKNEIGTKLGNFNDEICPIFGWSLSYGFLIDQIANKHGNNWRSYNNLWPNFATNLKLILKSSYLVFSGPNFSTSESVPKRTILTISCFEIVQRNRVDLVKWDTKKANQYSRKLVKISNLTFIFNRKFWNKSTVQASCVWISSKSSVK